MQVWHVEVLSFKFQKVPVFPGCQPIFSVSPKKKSAMEELSIYFASVLARTASIRAALTQEQLAIYNQQMNERKEKYLQQNQQLSEPQKELLEKLFQ